MISKQDDLVSLVAAVQSGRKYRSISSEFISRIAEGEMAIRSNYKEAVKATKNKLHQVGAVYFEAPVDYDRALRELRISASDPVHFKKTCLQLMGLHISTRERLSILNEFYGKIFSMLPPIRSVQDIACGFNPLALSWMKLCSPVEYYACDIYNDLIDFLKVFFQLCEVQGTAEIRDVTRSIPTCHTDLALLLKVLPCLEQIEENAGMRLLESVRADHLVVSFPVRSVGGWDKGMVRNYSDHFRSMVAGKSWQVTEILFASELVFWIIR